MSYAMSTPLKLAVKKTRMLTEALAGPGNGGAHALPAQALMILKELRDVLGSAAEANKTHTCYEALRELQQSVHVFTSLSTRSPGCSVQRARMVASFLERRMTLLAPLLAGK